MDADRWERRRQRWEERRERRLNSFHHPSRHLFAGLIFVAVGLIFLLGNMGYVRPELIFRFWPVILIAAGVVRLADSHEGYRSGSGIFFIVIGFLFLMASLNIFHDAARDIWPIILIGLGAMMLWRTSLAKREREELGREAPSPSSQAQATEPGRGQEPPSSTNSIFSATAILGGVARRNSSQDFRGGDATAIMGGCQIDLRAANITPPHEPVLEVFAMWGGVEIRVPPDWTVIGRVDPILGGFADKTTAPKDDSKRFVVRGSVVMGGVEVKN
jgi:predicted membrane protein